MEDFDHIPTILNEPIFKKGFDIAEVSHLSSDQYDAYLKSILEYNEAKAALDTAFVDGKTEGKTEGKIEGKIEVAKTMLAEGFKVSVIEKITKLTLEEIENLK